MWVRSLGRKDLLESEMATHSSIFAWRISWTKESGGLQSIESQNRTRLRGLSTQHTQQCHFNSLPFIPACFLNTKWIKFCLLRFIHGIILQIKIQFQFHHILFPFMAMFSCCAFSFTWNSLLHSSVSAYRLKPQKFL